MNPGAGKSGPWRNDEAIDSVSARVLREGHRRRRIDPEHPPASIAPAGLDRIDVSCEFDKIHVRLHEQIAVPVSVFGALRPIRRAAAESTSPHEQHDRDQRVSIAAGRVITVNRRSVDRHLLRIHTNSDEILL